MFISRELTTEKLETLSAEKQSIEFFDLINKLSQFDQSAATQLHNYWLSKNSVEYGNAKIIIVQYITQSHQTQNYAVAEIFIKLLHFFA